MAAGAMGNSLSKWVYHTICFPAGIMRSIYEKKKLYKMSRETVLDSSDSIMYISFGTPLLRKINNLPLWKHLHF